jgi:ABC-type multidrug transport system fused ATPase/permease subunit
MTESSRIGDIEREIREKRFEQTAARLEKRLAKLRRFEGRFAWYRLAALGLGIVATWMAAIRLSREGAWLVFLVSAAVFVGVARLHNRLEKGISRFQIWRELRLTQLARMRLDWEGIPATITPAGQRSAMEIDLDLSGTRSLHQLLDIATSMEGSQRLWKWLSNARPDLDKIAERQAVVRELAKMPRFRDRLLLSLRMVSKEQLKGEYLLNWLTESLPEKRLKWLLLFGTAFVVLDAILFALNSLGILPAYWMLTLTLYLAFYLVSSRELNQFLNAVVDLDRELDKFSVILRHLETYPMKGKDNLARLCAQFRDPDRLPSNEARRIKWVTAAVGLRQNPIIGLLLNLFLPWDFLFAYLAGNLRQRAAAYLPVWLDTWYQLEALSSLANLAYLNPDYSFPEIATGVTPAFQAAELGHPLIPTEKRVCNDFSLDKLGRVVVITGSNMAGKSTFIKTIGINLCLAYAGGPVNAVNLRCAPFRLHTCMRITDSVTDGFSYFYAEVKCLKALLDGLREDNELPLLYLIDEIFRGTNNRERLIGSKAFVRALTGAYGAGLIATHDLELAHLAQTDPQVCNYHFRDQVAAGRLTFDYKIQSGPSRTTNALRIMRDEGLPITDEVSSG